MAAYCTKVYLTKASIVVLCSSLSVCGLAVFATGLLMVVSPNVLLRVFEKVHIDEILADHTTVPLKIGAFISVGIGSLSALLGVAGIIGIVKGREYYWILRAVFVISIVIVVAELCISVAAMISRNDIRGNAKKHMRRFFDESINNGSSKNAEMFHFLEWEFDCCGVNGRSDYDGTTAECGCSVECDPDPEGCWDAFVYALNSNTSVIIWVGLFISALEIIGLFVSFWLFRVLTDILVDGYGQRSNE